jgi:hypothetical protein
MVRFFFFLWVLTSVPHGARADGEKIPPGRNASARSPQPAARSTSSVKTGDDPAQIIRTAHNFFQYGQYEKVVSLLRPIIERGLINEKADLTEALRMYGISLFLTGRKPGALLVFGRVVDMDPTLRLDPRLVPPEVVTAFDKIRKQHLAKKVRRVRHTRSRYAVLNFIPPAGQFQNGQHLKAWLILAAEVSLLAVNLASYGVLRSKKYRHGGSYVVQNIHGEIVEDHRKLAKSMLGVNYASFGLLLATVVYGIVDGYVVMHRQEKKERKRRKFLEKQLSIAPGPGMDVGVSLAVSF